jgi:hypothetical protein
LKSSSPSVAAAAAVAPAPSQRPTIAESARRAHIGCHLTFIVAILTATPITIRYHREEQLTKESCPGNEP